MVAQRRDNPMRLTYRTGDNAISIEFNETGPASIFPVSNEVRNAANKRRSLENPEDVVYTSPDLKVTPEPFMPSGFPVGQWWITEVLPKSSDYLAPFFLATDAFKMVPSWSLSPAGDYDKPTGRLVRDAGYGLHFAKGTSTTLGCIRFINKSDLEAVAKKAMSELKAGRGIRLSVLPK